VGATVFKALVIGCNLLFNEIVLVHSLVSKCHLGMQSWMRRILHRPQRGQEGIPTRRMGTREPINTLYLSNLGKNGSF